MMQQLVPFYFVNESIFNKSQEIKSNPNALRRGLFQNLNVRFYSNVTSGRDVTALYVPVVVYSNAELQIEQILAENKGKPGIYIWVNKKNGKSYVGSAIDLKDRLKQYYSLNLMRTKIMLGQSAIYTAILKYGHSNFKLEILEYCDQSDVIARENYYLNLLKPEYNILQVAGSSLGYKHREESKEKIRASLVGRNAGENNPMFGVLGEEHPRFGKRHTEEIKSKMSKSKGTIIEVLDMQTKVRSSYFSINKAAEAMGCSPAALTKGFKKSNPYVLKKRYVVSKGDSKLS